MFNPPSCKQRNQTINYTKSKCDVLFLVVFCCCYHYITILSKISIIFCKEKLALPLPLARKLVVAFEPLFVDYFNYFNLTENISKYIL